MRLVACDIETESLEPETIWVICCEDIRTREKWKFLYPSHSGAQRDKFNNFAKEVGVWVFHNGLNFDVPVINRILGTGIDPKKVIDTLVVSRLKDYSIATPVGDKIVVGHSLKAWGKRLHGDDGKLDFNDFSRLTPLMVEYCEQDTKLTADLFLKLESFIKDPENRKALRVEHDIAIISQDCHENGFLFDSKNAHKYLADIKKKMEAVESGLQEVFPPYLVEVKRLKYRIKKDGDEFSTVKKAREEYPKTEVDGEEFVCYDWKIFNPGSSKDRIEKLNELKWKPFEKTKGHKKFEREYNRRTREIEKRIRELKRETPKQPYDRMGNKRKQSSNFAKNSRPEGAPVSGVALPGGKKKFA